MTVNAAEYRASVERWFEDFESALARRDRAMLEGLFGDPSYLRDNGALTWDFLQFHGRDAVVSTLLAVYEEIAPSGFIRSERWGDPRLLGEGMDARLEAFAEFETMRGRATALINAVPNTQSRYGFDVFALFTRLEEIKDVAPSVCHPRGIGFTPRRPDENWLDRRNHMREYVNRDPDVLIIGGGQAGLITAAYLKNLGVDALIVDKNERIGDNWRHRYDSLFLHNPIEMNDFPFLEFPPHYPEYLPKDAMGEWLELYQQYLDLPVWLSTEFVRADYDEDQQRWTATVRRDGQQGRVLYPKHIVHCTGGFGGRRHLPKLPGLSGYQGTIIHSDQYKRPSDYSAKRAVIFGAGTSGHDIAEDLHANGVEVSIVQRGPIVVTNLDTANELVYSGYLDPAQPTELVDIRSALGWIRPLRVQSSRRTHQLTLERDAELISSLKKVGMKFWDGPNGMGWTGLYWIRGGGYYINKGASELIASGEIGLLHSDQVTVVANGLKLENGSVLEFDLLICATGYENRKIELSEQFGETIAAKLGEVGVLDEHGEWRGFWGQSGQRGLWLNGSGINSARPQSARVALLIKADLEGAIPDSFRRPPIQDPDNRFTEAWAQEWLASAQIPART